MDKLLRTKTITILLLLVILVSLTACGTQPTTTSNTPAPSQQSAVESEAPAQPKAVEPEAEKSGGGEIALVPPGMTSPYYDALVKGARPVAEELGYKLTVLSPEKESDAAGQVKIVEDLITKKVKAIEL